MLGAELVPLCPKEMTTPFIIATKTATLTVADSGVVPLDGRNVLHGTRGPCRGGRTLAPDLYLVGLLTHAGVLHGHG